jgi:DNA-binding NtrC family response regulator
MDDLSHPAILCIDDKATDTETGLLRSVLEGAGYRVLSASGAGHALEIFRRHEIDLVLMEQRVPTEVHGCSVAKILKHLKPGVPLVIYTADWTQFPEDLRIADAYVVSVEELLSTIEKVLNGRLTQADKAGSVSGALRRSAA